MTIQVDMKNVLLQYKGEAEAATANYRMTRIRLSGRA